MLVNKQTLEKRLSSESSDDAVRRAVRWAIGRMSHFHQGQDINIVIVLVESTGGSKSVGTFRTRPIGPSEVILETDSIRVLKGTKYRSSHPQATGVQVAKRPYVTVVGVRTEADSDDVRWKGNSGYICWTDRSNVELVIE